MISFCRKRLSYIITRHLRLKVLAIGFLVAATSTGNFLPGIQVNIIAESPVIANFNEKQVNGQCYKSQGQECNRNKKLSEDLDHFFLMRLMILPLIGLWFASTG
jgi:hypothetical protein